MASLSLGIGALFLGSGAIDPATAVRQILRLARAFTCIASQYAASQWWVCFKALHHRLSGRGQAENPQAECVLTLRSLPGQLDRLINGRFGPCGGTGQIRGPCLRLTNITGPRQCFEVREHALHLDLAQQ